MGVGSVSTPVTYICERGFKMENVYRKVVTFENGYSASIISNENSYGGREGLFEIGVLDRNLKFTKMAEFDFDAIGYLDFNEVADILNQIKRLPSLSRPEYKVARLEDF